MNLSLTHRHLDLFAALSAAERDALVASARTLKQAALQGRTQPLLRGKNIGLLCEAPESADAQLFVRAASELGAHVAQIRPKLSALQAADEVQHTAHMLGRLYDAIECEGLPAPVVQHLREQAGVPVYDGLAGEQHPSAELAAQLGEPGTESDNRRYLLQALLVSTVV